MSNRAYTVRAKQGWFGKIKGYVISDGLNEIHLDRFDWFTINTKEPITEPLLFRKG